MATSAWMLRQDGASFGVKIHLYCMQDDNLDSEAECASFLIKTASKDINLAEYVLDCWMALLIEYTVPYDADSDKIDKCIETAIKTLPYTFPYKLSISEYLDIHHRQNNYTDVDTLYDFVDAVRANLSSIQDEIKWSLNQQFCRVRYGGEYNTDSSNNTLWFRISSVRFNWADVIYIFASNMKNRLKVQKITICRDFESDNGDSGESEYFYKAKDGAIYRDMPIEEFLQEEHEHSLVFSNRNIGAGVYNRFQKLLRDGFTIYEINNSDACNGNYITSSIVDWFRRKDWGDCIFASEFMDNAPTRTRAKLGRILRRIRQRYPEIEDVDVDAEPRENNKGQLVGTSYTFILESKDPQIDGLEVRTRYTKQFVPEDILFRDFRLEYDMWKQAKGIK